MPVYNDYQGYLSVIYSRPYINSSERFQSLTRHRRELCLEYRTSEVPLPPACMSAHELRYAASPTRALPALVE